MTPARLFNSRCDGGSWEILCDETRRVKKAHCETRKHRFIFKKLSWGETSKFDSI